VRVLGVVLSFVPLSLTCLLTLSFLCVHCGRPHNSQPLALVRSTNRRDICSGGGGVWLLLVMMYVRGVFVYGL
jgi:hypothetical protein